MTIPDDGDERGRILQLATSTLIGAGDTPEAAAVAAEVIADSAFVCAATHRLAFNSPKTAFDFAWSWIMRASANGENETHARS